MEREISEICSTLEKTVASELDRVGVQLGRFGHLPKGKAKSVMRSLGRAQRSMDKLAKFVAKNCLWAIRFDYRKGYHNIGWTRYVQHGSDVFVGDKLDGFLTYPGGAAYADSGTFYYYRRLTPKGNIPTGVKPEYQFHALNPEEAHSKLAEWMHNKLVKTLFKED
jgi:hypothetical protein